MSQSLDRNQISDVICGGSLESIRRLHSGRARRLASILLLLLLPVLGLHTTQAFGKDIKVSWSPSTGKVLGYYVYYGSTSGTVTRLVSTLDIAAGEVKPTAPSVTYRNVGLKAGSLACFRVRAYNITGASSYSPVSCKKV